jgi:transposase
VEALRELSMRLLADLKEAWDRLNQGPDHSSRPPSSRVPWERKNGGGRESDADAEAADGAREPVPTEAQPTEAQPTEAQPTPTPAARKPGKQRGAPGIGRTQVFHAHAEQAHYPDTCAGCGRPLAPVGAVAYTGFQAVDLHWGDPARPGLTLWVVDHRYYETPCPCGHRHPRRGGPRGGGPAAGGDRIERMAAGGAGAGSPDRGAGSAISPVAGADPGIPGRVAGAGAERRHDPSDDSRSQRGGGPGGRGTGPAVLASDLLHADETSWPEAKQTLWLWVFVATTATLYYVAGRGKELVENVLDGFTGWLMSDGWGSYRHYPRRLRCWAHLIRKARGLAQSCDRAARAFGRIVLDTLEALMAAVYAAREGPPSVDLPAQHAPLLAALRAACERRQGSAHPKTHALAVELLNDWEAIFQVLAHPELPLTNNAAERALRHWVILRKLSLGTRTPVGSRVVALLASVIDTCRQRGHPPWRYLERAIADRRAGLPLAPLPQ